MARTLPRFHCSWGIWLILALGILLLPLQWISAMVIAAAFHEFCHWVVIRLLGGRVPLITFGGRGASMYMEQMDRGAGILCALAGPVGSFLLVLLGHICPRLAFCGAIQGLYNLLPVYPMDGGRILCGLLSGVISEKRLVFFTKILHWALVIVMLLLGIYATFVRKLGFLPLLLCIFLCFRIFGTGQKILTNCVHRSKMFPPESVRQMKNRRDLE